MDRSGTAASLTDLVGTGSRVHAVPPGLRAFGRFRFEPDRLRVLDVPTLLLVGSDSTPYHKGSVATVAVALPAAQVSVLPGQQHNANVTAPALLADSDPAIPHNDCTRAQAPSRASHGRCLGAEPGAGRAAQCGPATCDRSDAPPALTLCGTTKVTPARNAATTPTRPAFTTGRSVSQEVFH